MPTELTSPVSGRGIGRRSASGQSLAFKVLGVRVDAVQIPDVVAQVENWIAARDSGHYIAVTGMHGISESCRNFNFRAVLNQASLVVADGMPLVWLGRWHGYDMRRRVYGPELTDAFCRETGGKYRHFFYGGAPGVADSLARAMQERYGVSVAGTYCPPFRPLTEAEDREVVHIINSSKADVVWVGLSTPKQETWMYQHRDKLVAPVMFGVGAAFDLNTGRLQQAPRWMRENGLEWLFRLSAEPKRLWRRYLVLGPVFAWNVSLELLGLKAFD
jgi:N-acetylglucosaminyldiphosphoundecaprenol N-acetyl-beta-D-mannosaminyltransferase